ncbi:MAG: PH domain-containing protein [Rubripirellula sp.]
MPILESNPLPTDQPRRLHPASLVFQVLAVGRQSLFPTLVFGWSAVKGSWIALVVGLGIVGLVILYSVLRYLTFRYRIADGELVVTEGLIFRKIRNVPVDRIQNVDLVQNLFHRLLEVAEVKVETASGTEPEATLRVLSMADVEKLRRQILVRPSPALAGSEASQQATAVGQLSRETLLEIPNQWLVKAGLASNRGMILVGVVLGFIFQQDDADQYFEWTADTLPSSTWMPGWVTIVAGTVIMLTIVRLLGIAWYLLRFHGYKLERVGEDFHITCGMITKVSATVPRRRIQFISVHRTPLLRWMKLVSIRIETAGGAGSENEDAASTVTRRWFVPILPQEQVRSLLGHLRPELDFDETSQSWAPLSPRAGKRLTRLSIILSALVSGIGFLTYQPWGALAGVVCLPIFLFWTRKHLRYLGYARLANGVLLRSGVWTRKTSMTFFDRIQAVNLSESPFDRRWKMASLSIDTAASGPASHDIDIGLLEADFAKSEFDELSQQSADAGMRWN